ncbi:hypothetical protein [Halalkalibacter akibai]|uniref:Uncharacterized protein n=1 Tax=Halalkalibacter akibai (strain ATCC 43226 / DSM 21942 / CIP 109018 / JCM 9157 / 1139) TaxID=1236973 RepID=W4QNI8_HALA3|nr:hypothetical protein [Halalkalibacter akibai]GAE33238.1 hypothetical protein JCM9157_229 [Halalkalibacter akibai JCM 9157]
MMKGLMGDFKFKKHYLAEIDHVGEKLKSWSWDIYIAANDKQEYRGKALAPGQGIEIPWTPIGENILEEMMALCEQQMPKHP